MKTGLPTFAPGQRWISEAEPELGMGILADVDKRFLTLDFPAAGCRRQYSLRAAPIRRMAFKPGDRVSGPQGRIRIERVEAQEGLFTYVQGEIRICETDLTADTAVSLPAERLRAGMSDLPALFDLRVQVHQALAAYQASSARGFLGGQVDLIPHQFYIAEQVCSRYCPRVMLSDETGLGKTIEAGLILHRLLVTGQINRVLIIVPKTLVHQWFVELYRKFSLSFRLFDADFCQEALTLGDNPFLQGQLGICSDSFVRRHPQYQEMICDAGWDMVVMDEAHHITDDPGFYRFMGGLGKETRGLMLLSATPEQMGTQSYFAQLRLLDPDRYHDIEAFLEEAQGYEETARKAETALARGETVDELLDAFGPGRVIFRNRRKSIKGFPGRVVELAPLEGSPDEIRRANAETTAAEISAGDSGTGEGLAETAGKAADETAGPDLQHDPRVRHLAELVRSIKPEKILVICRHRGTARAVAEGVQAHVRVDTARFDETMPLMTRDRQAAWFAREDGARLMVCSEIGSEGRNFQFVHRLYLFDLPLNPELLEQRIGRLDRIGQKETMIIHLPYILGSCQEILAQWFHKGLGLLKENINGLYALSTRFQPELEAIMTRAQDSLSVDHDALEALTASAAEATRKVQEELDRGRHVLLELNSFKPGPAKALIREIRALDRADRSTGRGLADIMERVLDHYGVETEEIDAGKGQQICRLSATREPDEQFPALPAGAEVVTFDRATAMAREDIAFLTWDHPFVSRVLEFFTTREAGTASLAQLAGAGRPGLILEALFLLELPDLARHPKTARFMGHDPVLVRLDHEGNPVADADLPRGWHQLTPDRPDWFADLPDVSRELLPALLDKARDMAEAEGEKMKSRSLTALNRELDKEISRLKRLARANPGITELEILGAKAERAALETHLGQAKLRLEAVRLVRLAP